MLSWHEKNESMKGTNCSQTLGQTQKNKCTSELLELWKMKLLVIYRVGIVKVTGEHIGMSSFPTTPLPSLAPVNDLANTMEDGLWDGAPVNHLRDPNELIIGSGLQPGPVLAM